LLNAAVPSPTGESASAAHPQIAVPVLQDRPHHSVGPTIPSPAEINGFESIAAHFQTVKAIPGARPDGSGTVLG
jgi:hypothetical protein